MTGRWATISEAASQFGISGKRLRVVLDRTENTGTAWRGQYLKSRWTEGRGGLRGLVREVWIEEPENAGGELTTSPMGLEAASRPLCKHQSKANWKLALIEPALAHPKGSRERGKALDAAAGATVISNGKRIRLSRRSLNRLLVAFEREGTAGLMRPERSDKGQRRYYVSRAFHREMRRRLSDEQLAGIDANLRTYFRQLVKAGESPSNRQLHLANRLHVLIVGEGIDLSPEERARICRVPSSFMREEVSRWRNVHLAQADAKGYADRRQPRIARHSDGMMPNDWWIADCTKRNFLLERCDNSQATPWAVMFIDVATHRVHITHYLLPKGKGITRKLVVRAFLRAVADWGLPVNLYFDNGGEFGRWPELVAGICKLSVMPPGGQAPRSINAQPYNSQAKALIEGVIGLLERTFQSGRKGFFGGNRMAKKTANLGKVPVPVKGGLPALQEWSDIDLRIYHGKAQGPGGMLRGRSPDQVLADAIAAGWRPCAADPMALLLAFSQEDKRQLRQGTFHFGGQTYGCPELDECHDDQVRFLAPECADWDWPGLPLLDGDGKPYALARVVQSFAFDDIDGAKAASRRKGANRRSLTALEKSVPPLALAAERRKLAEAMGPSPSIEPGARVLPSPDGAKIIRLMQDAPAPDPDDELDEASRAQLRRLAAFED